MAVTGHQQDAISEEAWLGQYIGLWFNFRKPKEDSPGYKAWKREMLKARSIQSDSLMADVLEELKSIPVNEHNEQPYLPSDGGIEYDNKVMIGTITATGTKKARAKFSL